MNFFLTLLLISISLGLDAFSVALAFGLCKADCTVQSKLRIALSFGFFQFIMPIIGYLIGSSIASLVDKWDHWIVFTVLSLIGLKMILEGLEKKNNKKKGEDISKGIPLLIASVATSIDALAVGFSIAFLPYNLILSSVIIGVVTFLMSYAGAQFGSKLGSQFIKKPEWIGGIALILLGLKFLLEGFGFF